MKAHKYMRAFYGIAVSGILGIVTTLVFKTPKETHPHLVAGPEEEAMREFKGSEPKPAGAKLQLNLEIIEEHPGLPEVGDELMIHLHPDDRKKLGVDPGDLIVVSAPGEWHGGLKSVHGRIDAADGTKSGVLEFPRELEAYAGFRHYDHVVITVEG